MKEITYETIKCKNKFLTPCNYQETELEHAISAAIKKVDYALELLGDDFPTAASTNNIYGVIKNDRGWHTGFWTGILWLSYQLTGEQKYLNIAQKHVISFRERLDKQICTQHHDMGFLYIPSCTAAYKLTGDKLGRETSLLAAQTLVERYQEKGKFIQAWGDLNDPNSYRFIIDCLLNIPLLYWAGEETKDNRYIQMAYNHFTTTINNIIREDASTYHTFYFEPQTGNPLCGVTAQGYSDNSCWARGQAWGIYGMMLTYLYKNNPEAIVICKKLLNYFLNRLPEDYIPYWDLIFTAGDEPKDSSAATIAVCGILELVKHLPDSDPDKELYENAINHIMSSLYRHYCTESIPESNGLLLHAVYNRPANNGIDECNSWGDYFYMEALVRLKMNNNWNPFW